MLSIKENFVTNNDNVVCIQNMGIIMHTPVPCCLDSVSHHVLPDFKSSSVIHLGLFLFLFYMLFLEDIIQSVTSVFTIC